MGWKKSVPSLGFSNPVPGEDKNRIGQYGTGVKSGSMRLAEDCIVFTVHQPDQGPRSASIGMLSYTLLKKGKETWRFPMIEYRLDEDSLDTHSLDDYILCSDLLHFNSRAYHGKAL